MPQTRKNNKTGPQVHRFRESSDWSRKCADAPWIPELYKRAFPDTHFISDLTTEPYYQNNGIDRILTLYSLDAEGNPNQLYVEEKFRAERFDDVALEFLSSEESGRPGWIARPMSTDYLVYVMGANRRTFDIAYVFPFQELQRQWAIHGERWIELGRDPGVKAFSWVSATNTHQGRRWHSISIAVPLSLLIYLVPAAQTILWPEELSPKSRRKVAAISAVGVGTDGMTQVTFAPGPEK